jgi:hypothetical protein
MAKAQKVNELKVITENKIGAMAEITGIITEIGVNISAICAYVIDNEAHFRLLTDNNEKVIEELRGKDYKVFQKEAIVVQVEDKIGMGKDISDKLKDAGIDLEYIYGTTSTGDCMCRLVFSSNDNDKAVKVLE